MIGYVPEAPFQLKYAPYRPVNNDTTKFARVYATQLMASAASKPGPREIRITPDLRMGTEAGVKFLLTFYSLMKPYVDEHTSNAPEGKLGRYGQTYGGISSVLTYAGWPSSPMGTTIPNGATYAKTRVQAAMNMYSERLAELGLHHVNKAREDYFNSGVIPKDVLESWEREINWMNSYCKVPESIHVQRHTNSGAPTFSSSPIIKHAILESMIKSNFIGTKKFIAGDLVEASKHGVVCLARQGRRFQNDGTTSKPNDQPVKYPVEDMYAKQRYVLSYWNDDIIIANKMSPSPYLAAERVRSVQAQALAAGVPEQVIAQSFTSIRYEVPCMEYQDAVCEIETNINVHRPLTTESICATGDFTGADNCHPPQLMHLYSKSLRSIIGDGAYGVHGPDSFCPAFVTSDDMTKAGGRFVGDPLDASTYGTMYVLKSGKGTTADEVMKFTNCYVKSALTLMFKNTDEPYTEEEHRLLTMNQHRNYYLVIKGDGWFLYVRKPNGSRAKYEKHMAWLLPACMVFMEGSSTRDIGGYELYMDSKSKIRVTPSFTNKVSKVALGDKTWNYFDRPFAANGWIESLKIASGHPLLASQQDSFFVQCLQKAGKEVGIDFLASVQRQVEIELAREFVEPRAVGELLLRDEPSRRLWDPKYMSQEWAYLDETLFVDIPSGFAPELFNVLGQSQDVSFADDVWDRVITTWNETFTHFHPDESNVPIAPMSRSVIGSIISSKKFIQ